MGEIIIRQPQGATNQGYCGQGLAGDCRYSQRASMHLRRAASEMRHSPPMWTARNLALVDEIVNGGGLRW